MTILGVDGPASVEDRAAEILTAIATTYEEGMTHLAVLGILWEDQPAPSVPALWMATPPAAPAVAGPAELPAEPPVVLLAEEPAMLPMPVPVAEAVVEVPVEVPVEVSADAPTAVEIPAAVLPEPAPTAGPAEGDDARVLVFADAATAEIPVQSAA